MKRRILGFQRRVWWPKCTPASSSSRMEATAMTDLLFGFRCLLHRRGSEAHRPWKAGTRAPGRSAGSWDWDPESLVDADAERLARRAPVAVAALVADVVAA